MDSRYEKSLEAEIARELKGLPDLSAPSSLIPRVSAAIAERGRAPWYRQAWSAWPVRLRAAALVTLAACFALLCLGAWRLPDTEGYSAAIRYAAAWFSSLATLWHALNALVSTLAQVAQQLGRGFLLACLGAVALAWAVCLGLGTACVRLALARR